jgi:hypothetical protein
MKSIYELELHEITVINGKVRVMRVPGGWIYERVLRRLSDTDFEVINTFVPYNEEFNASAPN